MRDALEQMMIEAYERGAAWAWQNSYAASEFLAKAARDYADKTLSEIENAAPVRGVLTEDADGKYLIITPKE